MSLQEADATPAWASALADELVGFEHVDMAPAETGSARVARERRDAAERQRKSRDKRKRQAELDAAIAQAVANILHRGGAYERIRVDGFGQMNFRVEGLFAEASSVLVETHGWPRPAAARALTRRLLRPVRE